MSPDPALTHVPSLASQPEEAKQERVRRGRHKVSQNDPLPSKDRIKEEVKSIMGDEKAVDEFVEFTEEYKQGNVSISSGSFGATKRVEKNVMKAHQNMTEIENEALGVLKKYKDDLSCGESDSSLQMNKDLYDQKKLNAERESLLHPGTIAKDKYGEYGYNTGEGVENYEKAVKDDPELRFFDVNKNTQYGKPVQRTQMEILAAKMSHENQSSYKRTLMENDGLMDSLNELNF